MTEQKKDLIDLVREGKQIEIYEAGQELKEGDVISDWRKTGIGQEEARRVIGKVVGLNILGRLLLTERCKYCNSLLHEVVQETRQHRKGRDGRTYYCYKSKEDGKACPLCEAEYY